MRILYVSCHSVLQVSETKLLRNLGHKVDIVEPSDQRFTSNSSYDIILICHRMKWLEEHWNSIDHKKTQTFYRSIGQSTPQLENALGTYRKAGVIKIIRYSPCEAMYTNYAGSDGLVRFSKDENVYKDWTGENRKVVMFANHIVDRPTNCKLYYMHEVTKEFDRVLHGWGNESIKEIPTEALKFDEIPEVLRKARVLFYTGTFPASYTLNFIEALMTGVPIVSIGKNIFYENFPYWGDIFEVPHILNSDEHYTNVCDVGFSSNNTKTLSSMVKRLLEDDALATTLSNTARRTALELFSEKVVLKQWEQVL